MAFNDSFGTFGHFAFSSKPTHGMSIYESLSESMGDSYNSDFSSLESARLYASAMCLASAQYQLDRALNNRDTSKATELLTQLERDYQVTPGQFDTLQQRRNLLSAMAKVSKGNSQGVISAALTTLLGDNFVSYYHLSGGLNPTSPGDVGVFDRTGEPCKQFYITDSIYHVGVPITVSFTMNGISEPPIAGETYCVDPDPRSMIEKVTVISVAGNKLTAIFLRSHDPGAVATRPYPLWSSHGRYNVIVVKLAVAQDQEVRRKINELMGRTLKGVSQWAIVSDQGSFILDSATNGILGSTALG